MAPEGTAVERAALSAALARDACEDKARLKQLGVVHTPPPLVHFALTRIEHSLRRDFHLAAGLSSERIQLLDPALGTGIWLSALLSRLRPPETPRALLGFEADAGALASARALLTPAARAAGVTLTLAHENTLSLENPWLPGDALRVVLGNPPWGARSASRGLALNDAWLREFHHDHEGKALRERRTGVLSDDYVRFFRWALEQARNAPRGALVCFVTNASYLDGPVHRGMRAALLASFDRMDIYDLGGGSLRSRASEVDEPLFPVRVGAALCLCVRSERATRGTRAGYERIAGTRAQKLTALQHVGEPQHTFTPAAPWFRLTPPVPRAPEQPGFSLQDAFPFHAEGVQTNRDALATDRDPRALLERLWQIAQGGYALTARVHFDPERVRAQLRATLSQDPSAALATLAYRPLEARFYCKLAPLCHRPRPLLARAAAASELCLLSTRKELGSAPWNMFALSEQIADSSFLSVRSSCRTRVFPSHDAHGAPNVSDAIVRAIAERIGRGPSVRELMLYVGGVLGAPSYRREHADALRHDYARVPWPRDEARFLAGARTGALFLEALSARPVRAPTLALCSSRLPSERVSKRTLRWLSPHQLELCSGTEIGAGEARPFRAWVGHHELVARAYQAERDPTIAEVLEACERAALWVEAENAADEAYQPASLVRRAAKTFAADD